MSLQNSFVYTPPPKADICCCLILSIPQETAIVKTRFGKYVGLVRPGGGIKVFNCFFEDVSRLLSLKLQQLDIKMNAKTIDDAFMNVEIRIQYWIRPTNDMIYKAAFTLSDPRRQIEAYVLDVARSAITKLTVKQVYEEKDVIASQVKESLTHVMNDFGFNIVATPITNVSPEDPRIVTSMDSITRFRRELESARAKNEQHKLEVVKKAEAEMKTMELQGEGVSLQRQAIVDGLRESVASFQSDIQGVSSKDVLELILVTQYFDMMKDIGASSNNTMFVQHSPGAVAQIGQEIRDGFERANLKK